MEMQEEGQDQNKTKLEQHLVEDCEDGLSESDLLDWWKKNATKFKVLSVMSWDVFAILVFTVASESTFSTLCHQFRSCLTPSVVQALICAQD